jgi:hypothetical protein
MAVHCTKEQEIAQLYKTLIGGNGQPSVVQQLTTLNANLATYMKRQEDLITEFGITSREFYDFRTMVITTDKEREKARESSTVKRRWAIGIGVAVATTAVMVLSGWMLSLRKEQKNLQTEVAQQKSVPRSGVIAIPVEDLKEWKPSPEHVDSLINLLKEK